jgi:DNA-binding CsgD family transcriptional regulator
MAAEAEAAAGGRRLSDLLACVQLARGYALINLGEYGRAYEELRRGDRAGAQASPQHGGACLASLSAQELQIARLAAEGLPNREIGERLYLSPRTIGSHLYRMFPKLDVISRTQLAALPGLLAAGASPRAVLQPSMQSAD